ncbi:MAG TPA: hypothetical protein PKI27_09715, partial [Dermatophilaceae bacterium]|nr:hypothetical protein [Dermatophilaceae bacterium]
MAHQRRRPGAQVTTRTPHHTAYPLGIFVANPPDERVDAPGGLTDRWVPSALEQERRAYRRSRTVRSAAIASISTILVVGALGWVLTHSSGWPRVQETFFDWDKAVASFPAVLNGLWLNIRVLLVCSVLIAVLGLTIAVMRTLRGPVFFPLRLFGA